MGGYGAQGGKKNTSILFTDSDEKHAVWLLTFM